MAHAQSAWTFAASGIHQGTFHFYIRLQIRDATAASVTIVPRIFAEMVNQKGSVQWILQGPDRDLASLVNEIQKYISNRTGA